MDASPVTPAPDALPAEPKADPEARRRRVVVLFSAVGALAVMVGVVVLAKVGAAAREHEGPPAGTFGREAPAPQDDLPPGCSPDYDSPPRLVLSLPAGGLEFGAVRQGDSPEREFEFHNGGTGLLCLKGDLKPGCGCVKAHYVGDKRKYEPGEIGKIHVQLLTDGREGPQHKSITIYSNDPDHPTVTFHVKVDISLGLLVTQNQLNFGNAVKDHETTQVLRLKSPKADAAWEVKSVLLGRFPGAGGEEPPPVTFVAKEVEDPAWRVVDLSVTFAAKLAYGVHSYKLTVATTHPERPSVDVSTMVTVVAPAIAVPQRAVLGYVPPGRPARIRVGPGQAGIDVKVTGVRIEPPEGRTELPGGPAFTATFGKIPEGVGMAKPGEWWVEIAYDGKTRKPGLVEAVAVVALDLPDYPELRIPVTATIASAPAAPAGGANGTPTPTPNGGH